MKSGEAEAVLDERKDKAQKPFQILMSTVAPENNWNKHFKKKTAERVLELRQMSPIISKNF